jgi:cytosine/adenosine deaminase-related metal-dependent hydrolase
MGLKLVLAFESSDRDGEDVFHASVQENLRAIETYSGHESLRAIFGLHASFTLSDESLRSCAEASDAPFHIHCAESEWDLVDARERGFDSVIDRLDKLGILRPGTLLAHGIHLAEGDAERIREADCRLIHCPQSNEFNGLGRADVSSLSDDGVLLGLGSDGFGSGMLKEASLASAEGARLLGEGNARIASDLFGRNIGRLQAGADADFITLDEEGGVAQCVSSGKLVFDASESNSDALQKLGDWARGEASRLGERIGLEG